MRFIKINNLATALAVALAVALAFAEDAPKEGAEPNRPNNTEFVEYSKRLNKMTQLQTRIKDDTTRLQQLIKLKNSGVTEIKDDKNNRQNILDVIVEQHKGLLKSYEQFNEELRSITYRYPSKGEEISRKYLPMRAKTLEQVEREMGLSGELDALKEKIDAKYQAFAPPEEPTPTPTKAASTVIDKKAAKPNRLKLSK